MSQQVVSFKLLSGEEVIGRVENETDDVIVLSKVRSIQMVQTGPQSMGLHIMPYMASNLDGDISFRRAATTTVPSAPSSEAEKPYIENTTSIALAQ